MSDEMTMNKGRDIHVFQGGEYVGKTKEAAASDALFPERPFDPFQDIIDFHRKFGLAYDGKPRALEGELYQFRRRFKDEELKEFDECQQELEFQLSLRPEVRDQGAIASALEKQLDAIADLVYVVLGTAYMQGFDFREAWRRVHAANMAKVRAEVAADSKRGSTYDVIKPAGWTAPDHSDLVQDHAHK